jgi:hypothetical protein
MTSSPDREELTMTRRRRLLFIAPAAIAGLLAFAAIGGEVVKVLWNWLLPPLFGLPSVTFWQALGLLALSRILFGGFGLHGSGRHSGMRGRLKERWEHMTPEEREHLRQRMRERWGAGPSTTATGGQ